jgi:hypothetical protein
MMFFVVFASNYVRNCKEKKREKDFNDREEEKEKEKRILRINLIVCETNLCLHNKEPNIAF